MSLQDIQNGIAAAQNGDYQTADQLLRQGLNSTDVFGNIRAVALMWLSTTNPSIEFKIQCYRAAQQADPHNADVQRGLAELIASQAPAPNRYQPPPPPAAPQQNPTMQAPTTLPAQSLPPNQPPDPRRTTGNIRTVQQNIPQMWEFGIKGGTNGIGTGFLVVRDGLVATSRFIVGNRTHVVLESRDGGDLDGRVVRSYPKYDLAFVRIRLKVPALRDTSPLATVAPETVLIADDYTDEQIKGKCRGTKQVFPEGWFPTTFRDNIPNSFTGAPLIDEEQDLVGMLTRNASRNNKLLYGLHVSIIRRKIEEYYTEVHNDSDRLYCGTCGKLSKAGAEGLFYCEFCGALFPFAEKLHRTPHPKAHLYYEEEER